MSDECKARYRPNHPLPSEGRGTKGEGSRKWRFDSLLNLARKLADHSEDRIQNTASRRISLRHAADPSPFPLPSEGRGALQRCSCHAAGVCEASAAQADRLKIAVHSLPSPRPSEGRGTKGE